MVGCTISYHRIVGRLGEEDMGVVYRAEHAPRPARGPETPALSSGA
jgi:hypothetical protein